MESASPRPVPLPLLEARLGLLELLEDPLLVLDGVAVLAGFELARFDRTNRGGDVRLVAKRGCVGLRADLVRREVVLDDESLVGLEVIRAQGERHFDVIDVERYARLGPMGYVDLVLG